MDNMHAKLCAIGVLALAVWSGLARAEAPAAEKGETLLAPADAEKVLAELAARFKAAPALKARIVTEMEDLVGTRKEEGELLLDRPGRMLRKFSKPSARVQALIDDRFVEYLPALKKLAVKDFSRAPHALQLVQAAFTVDAKALSEMFSLAVFEKTTPEGHAYRLVLTKKPEVKRALYSSIQARIAPKEIFFHEIEYYPEGGEKIVERYLDIQPVAKPIAADFAIDVPADVARQTDIVNDESLK